METPAPTVAATIDATLLVTPAPTAAATIDATLLVTPAPSAAATLLATPAPTVGAILTPAPIIDATLAPTIDLLTPAPTLALGTPAPTVAPTAGGSLLTVAPTLAIIEETFAPSNIITSAPVFQETFAPSVIITAAPLFQESVAPTVETSVAPTAFVTISPAGQATLSPTFSSTLAPTFTTPVPTSPPISLPPTTITVFPPESLDFGTVDVEKLPMVWTFQQNTGADSGLKAYASDGTFSYLAGSISEGTTEGGVIVLTAIDIASGAAEWTVNFDEVGIGYVNSLYYSQGSIFVAGAVEGNWFENSAALSDLLVLKIDPISGDLQGGFQLSISGTTDVAYSIASLDEVDGDLIIGGTSDDVGFVGRYSQEGVQQWIVESTTGTIATTKILIDVEDDPALTMLQSSALPDDSALVTDTTDDTLVVQQILSSTGDILWTDERTGARGSDLVIDPYYGNNVVTVGNDGPNILVRSLNYLNGTLGWEYTGREGVAYAVTLTKDDSYPVIVGTTITEESGRTDLDAFVLTLDRDTGSELCYYSFGSTSDDSATGVVAGDNYVVTVAGTTSGSLFSDEFTDFDLFSTQIDQALICSIPKSTAPAAFQDVAAGASAGVSMSTTTAVTFSVATTASVMAPGALVSGSIGVQVGSGASAAGTLSLVLINQLQFMATTNLIDAHQSNQYNAFVGNMEWANLWWSADSFIPANSCAADETNGVGASVFVGNAILIVGITIGLFVLHVLSASIIEGYWLAKDKARHRAIFKSRRQMEADFQHENRNRTAASSAAVHDDSNLADRQKKVYFDESTDKPKDHLRQRSSSLWMYFPHLELVFLLMAYEGAVAAQSSVITSKCAELVISAIIMMVLFPILLFLLTWRVIQALQIGAVEYVPERDSSNRSRRGPREVFKSITAAIRGAYSKGESIFRFADNGFWQIPSTVKERKERLSRQGFMISYEPVFRDFTGKGKYYILVILLRCIITSTVAALLGGYGVLASTVLCFVYGINFVLVAIWVPFSNSFLQFVELCTLFVNMLCLILTSLGASTRNPTNLDIIYGSYLLLQCLSILILTVPIYLDTVIIIVGKIRRTLGGVQSTPGGNLPPPPISHPTHPAVRPRIRDIIRFSAVMVKSNAVAMITSLRDGTNISNRHSKIEVNNDGEMRAPRYGHSDK